jgi:hypothetical protein
VPAEDAQDLLSKSLSLVTQPKPKAKIPFATEAPLPNGTNRMSSEMRADVNEYLTANKAALKALPESWPQGARFSMNWAKGFYNTASAPIVEVRQIFFLLAVDACYQAEQHNTTAAIRSIQNLSAISEALKRGFFIYYTAGCAGQNLSITALEHAINQGELSGDDLKVLRSIYSDTGRESRLESVMMAERCQGIWVMNNMRKTWSQSPVLSKAAVSLIYWVKRTPPLYCDEDYFDYLTLTDAMIAKAHLPLDQRLGAIPESSTPSKRRSAMFLMIDTQNWQKYIQRDLEALAKRSNARQLPSKPTACKTESSRHLFQSWCRNSCQR